MFGNGGPVPAEKGDRRTQRTKEALWQALMLITERGFEELTVQDILERADVGRATFYAHFDNKEDHCFATKRRCQRSSVSGVTMKAASVRAAGDGWPPQGRGGRSTSSPAGGCVA
jgi:Bacterial regulatory proteins, tetR family